MFSVGDRVRITAGWSRNNGRLAEVVDVGHWVYVRLLEDFTPVLNYMPHELEMA